MERYDAAVIGAGPDGLIAAHRLASAGLKVLVLERHEFAGGRAISREFHPGFRASPYADELPAIPQDIFSQLDPPRHGAILMPAPASACLSDAGTTVLYADLARRARAAGPVGQALVGLQRDIDGAHKAMASRVRELAPDQPRSFLRPKLQRLPWPGEEWSGKPLADALAERLSDSAFKLHLAAHVLSGTAASPYLMGTALHVLKGHEGSGLPRGGLGTLAQALLHAARSAGAVVRLGADIASIRIDHGKVTGLVLTGGEEIQSRTVLSTLDLKRTFLGLIAWSDLPEAVQRRVTQFRMAGGRARVLFALDAPPEFVFAGAAPEAALGSVHMVTSLDALSRSHDSWRAGLLPDVLPVTLRVPSLLDPMLAPIGKAVMTATISGVPSTLVDGDWNKEKRTSLAKIAVAAAERAAPGVSGRMLAAAIITPREIETELGLTEGDFDGGDLSSDQALGFRPFPDWRDGRTPLRGVYLGGPSAAPSPFLLGTAGAHAATRLLADLKIRRAR